MYNKNVTYEERSMSENKDKNKDKSKSSNQNDQGLTVGMAMNGDVGLTIAPGVVLDLSTGTIEPGISL